MLLRPVSSIFLLLFVAGCTVAAPGDGAADATDCDDTEAGVTGPTEWYADADADGYGAPALLVSACAAPAQFVANADDCDDSDALVNPDGTEVCDSADKDENCDGAADDNDSTVSGQTTRYQDSDEDGYGLASAPLTACDFTSDYAIEPGDCDDSAAGINPGAVELCDSADLDEDCDGAIDDADPGALGENTFYHDGDSDGFGHPGIASSSCDGGGAWITDGTDCDDADAADYPGATELAGNADDEDCDGAESCYVDADDDGYRSGGGALVASEDTDCSDAGEALDSDPADDCDDTSAATSPGSVESCNLIDDDCNGSVDDGVGSTYYIDADGDGYGAPDSTSVGCSLPAGYADNADDCDDTTDLAAPGLPEECGDGLDNDCEDDPEECSYTGTHAATTYDFRLSGNAASDYMGKGVAVGDFDGDGTGDIAGGMYTYDTPATSAGAAVTWYGPLDSSGTATATGDSILTGAVSSAYVGFYLAAGDHDGDGADELVVGAYGTASSAGAVYIVQGGTRRLSSGTITTAASVATVTGATSSDFLGYNVAAGGDMDGDGTEEIILGAYGQDGAASSAGAAYLLYGSGTPRSGTLAATGADATYRGIASGDSLGFALSFVSDMDGDGLDELLLGAYSASADYGAAYLFLGSGTSAAGTISASAADVTYSSTAVSDYAGYGVYDLTDVTGDGYADAGVHGYGYDSGSSTSVGALWVFAGGTSLSTTATATLFGTTSSDNFGEEAYSPGDQDGDGINDLLVGAYGQDTAYSSAGAAYMWFGPVSGSMSASTADATFNGATTGDGYFGRRMPDEPGDVTGDGIDDIILGAYWDDSTGTYDAGALYVWAGLGGE